MTTRRRVRSRDLSNDPDFIAASTAFYCSWGHHRTFVSRVANERFESGTMCIACQLKIAENVQESIFMPELSAAMYQDARRKFEAGKQQRAAHDKLTAGDGVTGLVYYIRINGQIKIGYTANLLQRSRNYPPGSELLAVEPATPFTERERHQDFHRFLVRGREWFTESPELAAHIAKLAEVHGIPEELMHKFTRHAG